MKRRFLVLALSLMLIFSALAFAEETVTVIDGMGREVAIASAPERVVSLTPANTEILFALGVGDKLVGVDSVSDYPAEVAGLPIVGDYSGPNIEAIVAADPDVIFASTKLQADLIAELENLGYVVVCNEPDAYDEIIPGVQLIADVMGADSAGVIAAMEAEKDAALAVVTLRETPLKVYFAVSFGEYGDYSAGPGTFIDDMITMAGAVNVAGGAEYAWPMYSIEQLIIDDPDVILISDYMGDGSLIELLAATEGYKDLRCVQEGHVYAIDANTSNRPAPRINEALAQIVEALEVTD